MKKLKTVAGELARAGFLGAPGPFQRSCPDVLPPSLQGLSLPWSTSTPSSHWLCPASWSSQTEVGTWHAFLSQRTLGLASFSAHPASAPALRPGWGGVGAFANLGKRETPLLFLLKREGKVY